MSVSIKPRLGLRTLILLLSIIGVFITLTNAFYSTYNTQRELLINNTLKSHEVYAVKMAEMTDMFVESAQSQIAYSANLLSDQMNNTGQLQSEVSRLLSQTKTFNSVLVINSDGVIVSAAPEKLNVTGVKITNRNFLPSLNAQHPLITDPFISPAGNYLISISHPIRSKQGQFLGYISGTIYLEKENNLSDILDKHSYRDGSYLYVVDKNKTLIYHPDKSRIGQTIEANNAIDKVILGEKGFADIINSQGIDMISGFAPIKGTKWGVIVQQPKSDALSELNAQMVDVFIGTIPLGVLTIIGIWISAVFISNPLRLLARGVHSLGDSSTIEHIHHIRPWYFEVAHLKAAIVNGFSSMSDKIDEFYTDSHTDSVTGLLNKRGMLKALDFFSEQHQPFSIMALDIDYFKEVNDSYGHDVGDIVITAVANLMNERARHNDILCRSGGDEFIILLDNTKPEIAYEIAERLRSSVEENIFPEVGHITVSVGLSYCSGQEPDIKTAMKNADQALYAAKENGRNQIHMY